MNSARIVLPSSTLSISPAWCWRDDWCTGYDSVYGLLSKFARLNALNARELSDIFISRDCGRRTAILRAPQVDLRSGELFDPQAFAHHFRLEDAGVTNAFMLERLANRTRRSSDVLRWCSRCASAGFHSPAFQLELIAACPAHGQMLRTRCPRCRHLIPYRLEPSVFEMPFCCPTCSHDLAPCLREVRPRPLLLRASELAWIDHMTSLFLFEDRIIPIKLELNRRRKALGLGEFAIVGGDWTRVQSEYPGFVMQVLDYLEPQQPGTQRPLNFNGISIHTKRSLLASPLQPKKKKPRKKLDPVPIDRRTSTHVKQPWDAKLHGSYAVYKAVRRYLWRHVVRQHRYCISTTARHLWWHMEGESTSLICPVAEAFVRWRMHWEFCGAPCYLMAPMRKDPLGLVSWISAEAPICPGGWSQDAEQWVSDHLLGVRCFDSFQGFVDLALKSRRRKKIKWERDANIGNYARYWAVTGRDIPGSPTQIFQQSRSQNDFANAIAAVPTGHVHLALLTEQLRLIAR